MDEVYRELDEIKVEMEKLKAEHILKTELCKSLKEAHSEQLDKFRNVEFQIEKQAQELNAKSVEIFELRQKYEDLKSILCEKESFLRHLISVNEKVRADFGEKEEKGEGKYRELVLALDEATLINKDLEQKLCASNEETEGLKRLLLNSERKCLEVELKAQAPKELRQRDDMIVKLEEENKDVQDQLKWKKEQFKHLEEALERVKDQFWSSKEGWEREKSTLLEEISALQTSLNSQTRVSEGLKTQLMMCNQALAHEESRRKLLEVQVSEFNSRFENVFVECQEAKSKIDSLTVQRDEEIARLRNSLGTKATHSKEMEFRIVRLERENQELRGSLKELKEEAQINKAEADSLLMTLRNKLRGLEQVHGDCSMNLKATEAEWSSQLQKLKEDLNCYIFELMGKNKQIHELQKELEVSHSSIEALNEEVSLVLLVLKSEFSEAYAKLLNAKAEVELCNKEKKEKNLLLQKQLEMKCCALKKALVDLEQERVELALLAQRVQSFNLMEQQRMLMEEELERHKKLLEDLDGRQLHLKEKNLLLENAQMKDRRDFSEALETANFELAEKIREKVEIETELQKWKSSSESLKICLEEDQEICQKMGASLLAQEEIVQTLRQEKESLLHTGKEHEKQIGDLQQQIVFLQTAIATKVQLLEVFQQEKENNLRISEEKDNIIENLHQEIDRLKQESTRRESEGAILSQLNVEKTFEQEKERLLDIIKEKDQNIEDLGALVMSLKKDLTRAATSSISEVTQNQDQIKVLYESLEKAEHLAKLEIEEKNKKIAELEKEVNDLGHNLEFHKESLFHSKQKAEQLEESLEEKMLELKTFKDQLGSEQRRLEGLLEKLEFEKGVLLEDIVKLTLERENILVHVESISDWINHFSSDDVKMMEKLGKILQISGEGNGLAADLIASDELNDFTRKNVNISSPTTKKLEVSTEERLPLQELNH